MKLKTLNLLIAGLITTPTAMAGSLTVANSDLTLAGGLSAGALYSDNNGARHDTDARVTDFLVELSAPVATTGVGFVAAFGELLQPTVFANVGITSPTSTSLQYGSMIVKPTEALTFEAGKLATKIGYEVANTYGNQNILLGGLWSAQPVYYPGVRASYNLGSVTVFGEANQDTSTSAKNGYVVGASGAAGPVSYAVAYYNAKESRDILDIIVSTKIGNIPVAANLDYHMLDNATPGNDDSATGLALYATPSFGNTSVPVRIEYMDDGSSGIYNTGLKTGYTFTVTPTYNFSATTFVRAEAAYATADNKVFSDKLGTAIDSKTSYAVQAGFKF